MLAMSSNFGPSGPDLPGALGSPPVRLTPGTRVGALTKWCPSWALEGWLRCSGLGTPGWGRDVAIQVLSEALGGDGAFLERFDREAKLTAAASALRDRSSLAVSSRP
jgi:hypothetical protein